MVRVNIKGLASLIKKMIVYDEISLNGKMGDEIYSYNYGGGNSAREIG